MEWNIAAFAQTHTCQSQTKKHTHVQFNLSAFLLCLCFLPFHGGCFNYFIVVLR